LKLLGCMQRAHYAPENEGHFGLASTHYCHFTSPIRRYPDLVVHRNLKWLIEGREGPMPHLAQDLQNMCDHCSQQERAAEGLERRVKAACLVLASMHGETAFSASSARVTTIMPHSMFVLLDDGTEARVPGRELPGGPYQVDEWESMLFLTGETGQGFRDYYDEEYGEMRKIRAQLGDRVTAKLAGRNVAEGKTSAVITSWTAS
jgi:ribonuclease R